jgi:YVTN family beta-propeller protein
LITVKRILLAALLLAGCMGAWARAQTPPLYKVTATVALGAPDRWDYVYFDPSSHHVFVAHGTEVSVVDGMTGIVLGHVLGIPGGTHGITVVPEAEHGYTDDGQAGLIKVFNLKTFQIVQSIQGIEDADGIVRDPATGHVFVINGKSGTATVVDPRTNTVVITIRAEGALEAGVPDGTGLLYLNAAEKRLLLRVDTRTNAITARWPISDCESPHGIAMDRERQRVFVTCVNERMVVVDVMSGAEIKSLPIGKGTDAAAFDPVRRRIFSSNGRDGTLTVIEEADGDQYRVIGTVATALSGRTMDIDPQTGRIFIVAGEVLAGAGTPNGRPAIKPGSLKLLILDPVPE